MVMIVTDFIAETLFEKDFITSALFEDETPRQLVYRWSDGSFHREPESQTIGTPGDALTLVDLDNLDSQTMFLLWPMDAWSKWLSS